MQNILRILFVLVILLLVYVIFQDEWKKREEAREKREKLLLKRRKIRQAIEELKVLSPKLRKKFLLYLYPSYLVLFSLVFGSSLLISYYVYPNTPIEGFTITFGFIEVGIYILTAFSFLKAMEFIGFINWFTPKLEKYIYGSHFNINQQIVEFEKKDKKIGKQIKKLNKIIYT